MGAGPGPRRGDLDPHLRPGDDWPGTANLAAGLARVAAVLNRIASDAGELARARRAGELTIAAVLSGRRAERRRRLAEPDLDFRTFCRTKQMPGSTPARMERAWDAWQAQRHRRGEAGQQPDCTGNPFRGCDHPCRNPQAEHRCSGNRTL